MCVCITALCTLYIFASCWYFVWFWGSTVVQQNPLLLHSSINQFTVCADVNVNFYQIFQNFMVVFLVSLIWLTDTVFLGLLSFCVHGLLRLSMFRMAWQDGDWVSVCEWIAWQGRQMGPQGSNLVTDTHTHTNHDCTTSMRRTICLETRASLSHCAGEGLGADCTVVNDLGLSRNTLCWWSYRWSENKGSGERVQCSPVCLCVISFTHSRMLSTYVGNPSSIHCSL